MKVIHISPVFRPYRAGMVNVVWNQVLELANLGHEVTVLTPRYDKEQLELDIIEGVEIRRIQPLLYYGNGGFAPRIFEHLVALCQQVPSPIIHLHTPFGGGQEIVWFVKKIGRMLGAKLVIQYHHDPQFNWFAGLLSFPYKLTFGSLFDMADKVIASSTDYARNSVIAKYVDRKCFQEIPLGVDISRFEVKHSTNKSKKGDPLKLVFLGALDHAHHFKGVDILLQALSRLDFDRFHLTIIGKGELEDYYKKLSLKLGLGDRVEFAGFLSDVGFPIQLRLADVFVFPSTGKAEAFGLVAVEAMASGLPVIASDLPGVRTLFLDDSLLVPPGDIECLAQKIKFVGENRELLGRIGKQNRKIVEERYDWKKVVLLLEDLYKSLSD